MTSLSRIQLAACSLIAATSLAVATPGQTQLVRGDVDGIQGTLRFQLDCTNIELWKELLTGEPHVLKNVKLMWDAHGALVGAKPVLRALGHRKELCEAEL